MKVTMARMIFLVIASALCGQASWLSDITGIDINIPRGTINVGVPNPAAIPRMLENLPKDASQFFLNPVGSGLATAIRQAKEQAKYGCRPIPTDIQQTLSRFYPPELMGGVCYNVFNSQRVALDNLLLRDFTNVGAVTFEDVVVFRNPRGSSSPEDVYTWAHELMHVVQYRRLGLETFAHLYTFQFDAMENEAYNMQHFVESQIQSEQSQQQYWQVAPGWSTAGPLTSQQYVQAAKQYIDPLQCSGWNREIDQNGNPVLVQINNCPIPIRVTHFVAQNRFTGSVDQIPCQVSSCLLPPNTRSVFPDDPNYIFQTFNIVW